MSVMEASPNKLKDLLKAYVGSKGHDQPKEAELRESLLHLAPNIIFELSTSIRCTKSCTAVHYAARRDHAWILRDILTSFNGDSKIYNSMTSICGHGCTSLHLAAENGSLSSLQCMLELVAPEKRYELMGVLNTVGNTPVIGVAWTGQTDAMRLLLEILTPIERFNILKVQNSDGNTAMHDAAQQGHTQTLKCIMDFIHPTVQTLLLHKRNSDNATPLAFAERRNKHNTAGFIRQCIDAAERHVIEIQEIEDKLREDKQVQAAQLEVKEQQLEEKERQLRQLINVVAEQNEQIKQLTNEVLKAKEELANQNEEENTEVAGLRE